MKHTLKRKTPYIKHKSVGRGGPKGKNAGRGNKGQKSRAGHRMRPEVRDMIKKLPKLRGHGKNRARTVVPRFYNPVVNLSQLEVHFATNDTVTIEALVAKKLVQATHVRVAGGIKILGKGELTKKLTLTGLKVSAGVKEKIEKLGGSVQ